MQDRLFIEGRLRETARRMRLHAVWVAGWRSMLLGAGLWASTLVAYKLIPFSSHWLSLVAWFWGGLVLLSCLRRGLQPIPLESAARWLDRACKLKECLASALEVSETHRWSTPLWRDARGRLTGIQLDRVMPLTLPFQARYCLPWLLLAAILEWVPAYRSQAYLEEVADQQRIEVAGKKMIEFVRQERQELPPEATSGQESLDALQELGEQLAAGKLNRQQALKEVVSARERIEEASRAWREDPAISRLQQAAKSPLGMVNPSSSKQQNPLESALAAMESATDADPQAMKQLNDQLQSLADTMQQASQSQAGMDAATQQALGDQLSQLAEQAAALGLSSEALQQAMQHLAQAQPSQLLSDLKQAQLDLEKMLALSEALKDFQAQQAAAGQDLAEQLQRGQSLLAEARLQDMIRDLKAPTTDLARRQSILNELKQALQPAGDYGEVAKWLEKAMGELGNGQQLAASDSLEEAAAALESLTQQFEGMDAMMASLGMLGKAQMSLGNQMSWGQSSGPASGFSNGKLPGGGVGTWGQEGGDWAYRDPGARSTDNSGVTRPELEARGLTDRGEATLSEGLIPTQVRGNMQQGRPMASMAIKGLNLRGKSQVNFTEALEAAQSEAANALNQDRVPRAYQDTVRDYFSELE
jgi:hypothetical protein